MVGGKLWENKSGSNLEIRRESVKEKRKLKKNRPGSCQEGQWQVQVKRKSTLGNKDSDSQPTASHNYLGYFKNPHTWSLPGLRDQLARGGESGFQSPSLRQTPLVAQESGPTPHPRPLTSAPQTGEACPAQPLFPLGSCCTEGRWPAHLRPHRLGGATPRPLTAQSKAWQCATPPSQVQLRPNLGRGHAALGGIRPGNQAKEQGLHQPRRSRGSRAGRLPALRFLATTQTRRPARGGDSGWGPWPRLRAAEDPAPSTPTSAGLPAPLARPAGSLLLARRATLWTPFYLHLLWG